MNKEEIIKEFREKFVRHPAEIEGVKRVEWRQLAEDKVDEAENWLIELFKAHNQDLLKKIEEKADEMDWGSPVKAVLVEDIKKLIK